MNCPFVSFSPFQPNDHPRFKTQNFWKIVILNEKQHPKQPKHETLGGVLGPREKWKSTFLSEPARAAGAQFSMQIFDPRNLWLKFINPWSMVEDVKKGFVKFYPKPFSHIHPCIHFVHSIFHCYRPGMFGSWHEERKKAGKYFPLPPSKKSIVISTSFSSCSTRNR